MIRLVGGPYDGAEGCPSRPIDGAQEIWAVKDPLHRGPNGLILSLSPCNAPRYVLLGPDGDVHVYEFAGLSSFNPTMEELACA